MNKIKPLSAQEVQSTFTKKNVDSHHKQMKQLISQQPISSTLSPPFSHNSSVQTESSQISSSSIQTSKQGLTLKSNPKSLFKSFYNRVTNFFKSIYWVMYIVICMLCQPINFICKLILGFYEFFKPIAITIFQVLVFSIKWIFTIVHKHIHQLYKNPQVIVKFTKNIFLNVNRLIVLLFKKIKISIKSQQENGWPIFKFIKDLDKQQWEKQNQNDYDNLLQQLREQIENLQSAKVEINKDIRLLQQTTLDMISKKEEEIKLKKNQINQLKQENDQLEIKYTNEKYKVQQLKLQKLKYEKFIEYEHQELKINLEQAQNRHEFNLSQQKQNYQSQILALKQQKQLINKKLSQQIQTIKQQYEKILTKKEEKIIDFAVEIKDHKNQIILLKNQLHKVMIQHQNELKILKQKLGKIKSQNNKSNSQTQTLQIINFKQQHSIIPHPQLLKNNSIEYSQSQLEIKRYASQNDLKLTKTKTSIGEYLESQKRIKSNNLIPNLFSFSTKLNSSQQKEEQQINPKLYSSSRIELKKINSSIKIISNFPLKNSQQLNFSHTIQMKSQNQQNSISLKNQQQKINQKNIEQKKQDENNSLCLKFFIFFLGIWSVFFTHKLYELWILLSA